MKGTIAEPEAMQGLTAEAITAAVVAGIEAGLETLARRIWRDVVRGAPVHVEEQDLELLYEVSARPFGARTALANAFIDLMNQRLAQEPELRARYDAIQRAQRR